MSTAPLLEVEDLHVSFQTTKGAVHAVRGVSFQLGRERLGIVGESGSGKSQTGRAILRLLAPGGRLSARRLAFDGGQDAAAGVVNLAGMGRDTDAVIQYDVLAPPPPAQAPPTP